MTEEFTPLARRNQSLGLKAKAFSKIQGVKPLQMGNATVIMKK